MTEKDPVVMERDLFVTHRLYTLLWPAMNSQKDDADIAEQAKIHKGLLYDTGYEITLPVAVTDAQREAFEPRKKMVFFRTGLTNRAYVEEFNVFWYYGTWICDADELMAHCM